MQKWREDGTFLFLNYIKIKWDTWVSYSLKAVLDYSSLYRSMHFWCHGTTLTKMLLIEKLNLIWNKQTNFNKLGPFSSVFHIVVRGRGDGEFTWGDFSTGWWESDKEWFWPLEPFSKLSTTFCKYWTLIKIKISMACVYQEYGGKIKMVQKQWLQLKIKILLG